MKTDIELPTNYNYKNYSYFNDPNIHLNYLLGDENPLAYRTTNPYRNKMNHGNNYKNGIIRVLYTNCHIHTWRYNDNGTIYVYEQTNSAVQSHGLFVSFHKNGQLSHYRPCKYGKNDILKIRWDKDGNVTEKKKYVNGVEVE